MTQNDPEFGLTGAMARQRALVLFSGGQDSATCLAWALDRFEHVETLGFDYQQRHRIELDLRPGLRDAIAALQPAWRTRLGDDHMLDLSVLGGISETSLTRSMAIELAASGLPNSFVPGRNLLFLTLAAALAYRRNLGVLVTGVCETDFSGYPDCRDDTMKALQVALTLGLDRRVRIDTPLMWIDKAATWAMAHQLGGDALVQVIVTQSHTCYLGDRSPHAWGAGCSACPACELRAAGWARWQAGLATELSNSGR